MLNDLFKGVQKKWLITDIIFISLWSLFNVVFVELLSRITSDYIAGNSSIMSLVIGFFSYIIIWEISEWIGDFATWMGSTDIENYVDIVYLKKLVNIKPEILKKYNSGYISGLTSKFIAKKEATYKGITCGGAIAVFYCVYVIIRMSSINILLGISTLCLLLVIFIIKAIGNKVVKPHIENLSDAEANRIKLYNDSIINVKTIQKMQCSDFIDNKMKNICNECIKKTIALVLRDETFFTLNKLLGYAFLPLMLFIIHICNIEDKIDIVYVLSLLSVLEIQLVHNTRQIINTIRDYNEYVTVKRKIDKIVDENNKIISKYIRDFSDIKIQNVDYKYVNEDKATLIRIPEFEVKKGDKICIYGESGQGKTTTLNILSSEIETGSVLIDGKLLRDRRLDCAFIAQDTEMLDMTIRDNICMGADIPTAELYQLFDEVGLHNWLYDLPAGLDTFIGERGVFLSTGQRQRLNLIRGLLLDKELYLLDEPTSNVDEETEMKIIKLLNKRLKNKTVVIVSHRPAIKDICNKEYLFENGVCRLVRDTNAKFMGN